MQDALERDIAAEIKRLEKDFLEFATCLIRIDSANPPGRYEEVAERVATTMRSAGFEVEVIETPRERVRAAGLEHPRVNVIARLHGSGPGPSVVLNPHLDTVPVGDASRWSVAPLAGIVKDGRLYGRGACDCKGRLASFALAATALKGLGKRFGGEIVLAATADEEIGGALGAGYLLDSGKLKADHVIIEGFINILFYGYAGALSARIRLDGRSAHISTPWNGVNAVEKAVDAIGALRALQAELEREGTAYTEMRHSTIGVGTITGGVRDSMVPESCEMSVMARLVPEHDPEGMVGRIRARLEALAARDPEFRYQLTVTRTEKPYMSPKDSPVSLAIQRACQRVLGKVPPLELSRGGGDMRHFLRHGIPCIAFGPAIKPDSNHHGVDEHIELTDFFDASVITALAAAELLGIA